MLVPLCLEMENIQCSKQHEYENIPFLGSEHKSKQMWDWSYQVSDLSEYSLHLLCITIPQRLHSSPKNNKSKVEMVCPADRMSFSFYEVVLLPSNQHYCPVPKEKNRVNHSKQVHKVDYPAITFWKFYTITLCPNVSPLLSNVFPPVLDDKAVLSFWKTPFGLQANKVSDMFSTPSNKLQ